MKSLPENMTPPLAHDRAEILGLEGGTLDVADHWVNAHLRRGVKLQARRFSAALADFQAAQSIPDNLPSDRRGGGGRD